MTATALFFSNPLIFHLFASRWEISAPKNVSDSKVAVVLGGFASYNEREEQLNFSQSADRLMFALKLYYERKVSKILISGGSGKLFNQDRKEALTGYDYITSINFPPENVLLESQSKNTHENALATSEMLHKLNMQNDPVILITSAYHMPRAARCFKKAGVNIIPYPVDYLTDNLSWTPASTVIPQVHILSSWGILLHEWAGSITYQILGYY